MSRKLPISFNLLYIFLSLAFFIYLIFPNSAFATDSCTTFILADGSPPCTTKQFNDDCRVASVQPGPFTGKECAETFGQECVQTKTVWNWTGQRCDIHATPTPIPTSTPIPTATPTNTPTPTSGPCGGGDQACCSSSPVCKPGFFCDFDKFCSPDPTPTPTPFPCKTQEGGPQYLCFKTSACDTNWVPSTHNPNTTCASDPNFPVCCYFNPPGSTPVPTATPTPTPAKKCPDPSNLAGTCNSNTLTFTWTSNAACSGGYAIRVDDKANGWGGDNPLSGDTVNNSAASPFSRATSVGPTYDWWLHGIDDKGKYTARVDGTRVTCAAPTPTPTRTPTPTPTPIPAGPTPTSPPAPTPAPGSPTYSITGFTFIDTDQNGVRNGGEQCYSGNVTVSLAGVGSRTYSQDPSCINRYSFTNLAAGTYTVSTQTIPNYVSTTTNPIDVTVP